VDNMKDVKEYWGEWILPGRKNEKFLGVLRLSQTEHPLLLLPNLPSDFELPLRGLDDSPKIFGTTILNKKKISLFQCNFNESKKNHLISKKQILKIFPLIVFIDDDSDNDYIMELEKFARESFDLEYNLLYNWLWSYLKKSTENYTIVSSEINIDGNKYTIDFNLNESGEDTIRNTYVQRNIRLVIKSKDRDITFIEALKFNQYFQTFLSFATTEIIRVQKLLGYTRKKVKIPVEMRDKFQGRSEVSLPLSVECIIYQGNIIKNLKESSGQMFFDYKCLSENISFKESFEKWISLYEELSFYPDMFDSLYGDKLDAVSYFILLIPRIEQYYINRHGNKKIENIFNELIAENKEVLKRARVLEGKDFEEVITYKNTGKKNCENERKDQFKIFRFAEECKNVRHFYAHLNKCYSDKIPQDTYELARLSEKLKLFFDVLVLKELGLKSEESIIEALKYARAKTVL